MSAPPPVPAVRSSFVTTLAWIFIVLAGFATAISLLQNIMLELFTQPMLQLATQPAPPSQPPIFAALIAYMPWYMRGFLLLAVVHLAASIGLLQRKPWGRRLFIAVMAFDIVYQLGGVGLQWWISGAMESAFQWQVPAHTAGQQANLTEGMHFMHGMLWAIRVFTLIFALGFCVLFGWIIRRLCSEPIRREFAASTPPA